MRISDWSSDVYSSDLLVERDRQADGVADQPQRPSPPRQRSAVSENGGRPPFLGRREEAPSDRHLEEWRKSWMHPCVRCVSKLRVRCAASWHFNIGTWSMFSAMTGPRPEERQVGKAGVRTCRLGRSPCHYKKKQKNM